MSGGIEVVDLVRTFGSIKAVNGLSFAVRPGTIFGFLGPNGAGKTTTIRLLLGLLRPDSGGACVCGFDATLESREVRERCGVLLEDDGLYRDLGAARNLEFHARIRGMEADSARRRIESILKNSGWWERRDEPVGRWSRGMRRRLALARATLHRPEVVFLDEPTAGLDPLVAAGLREELALMAAENGITVFLTTHNLSEVEKLCQEVIIIQSGRAVASGTPEDLKRGFDDLEEAFRYIMEGEA